LTETEAQEVVQEVMIAAANPRFERRGMDEAPVRVEESRQLSWSPTSLSRASRLWRVGMESSLTVTANSRIWTDRNRLAEASSFKFLA